MSIRKTVNLKLKELGITLELYWCTFSRAWYVFGTDINGASVCERQSGTVSQYKQHEWVDIVSEYYDPVSYRDQAAQGIRWPITGTTQHNTTQQENNDD